MKAKDNPPLSYYKAPFWYCSEGQRVYDSNDQFLLQLRCYGYLKTTTHKPDQIQDAIGEEIARALTAQWNKENVSDRI